jgi:hypothetical protein
MKKLFYLFLVLSVFNSYSQTGNSAEDPIIINQIPFFGSDDTSNYSSYYNGYVVQGCCTQNCGPGSYGSPNLQGAEVVYSYTPTEDIQTGVILYGVQSEYPAAAFQSFLVVGDNLLGVDPNGGSGTVCFLRGYWSYTTTYSVSTGTSPIYMEAGNTYFIIISGGGSNPFSFILYDFEDGTPMSLDEENRLNVSIYPNPSSDLVFIKGTNTELEAIVFDLLGKQVMREYITDKLDISCLEKGSYIINLTDGVNTSSHKIIKN